MKKIILFALFCTFSFATFASNNAVTFDDTIQEELTIQSIGAQALIAVNMVPAECTVKTKTTITNPDGTKTTVESETTISMSCKELVKAAIGAIK
ncbi:MAG: hypothetical protein Sapg2KO_15540 [Saprospiraceae bacterium]